MIDMRQHIKPKSDQLNADDLIGGPMTVKITDVREMGTADQPIAISFEGDSGKPYKPCKSMMRALSFVWGPDGEKYVGKSMTLFLDPNVTWGGEKVGGIRISHMSDMPEPMEFPLTATRGRRQLYRVEPLVIRQRKSLEDHVSAYEAAVKAVETEEALFDVIGGEGANRVREHLRNAGDNGAALLERMTTAERLKREELSPADDLDDGAGDFEGDYGGDEPDPFGDEEGSDNA